MTDNDFPDNDPTPGADDSMIPHEHRYPAVDRGPDLTVGAEFRARREELHQSLRDVADVVRIQMRYLEALEDDRTDYLPGRVYALGFVRTYAAHLGLDAAEMVERFKQEAKGLSQQSDLTMPEPVDEGKVPTVAIIIVAILLAGVAYSAWYFMSGSDNRVVETVPEVPAHLAGLAVEDKPPVAAPADSAVAADMPAAPAETSETRTVTAPVDTPPRQMQPAALPPAPAAATAPEPKPSTTTSTTTSTASRPATGSAGSTTPSGGSTTATAAATPVPGTPPAAPSQPFVLRDPVVYGDTNVEARVVITALEDAWVEVTDENGAILFSRVLRKNDQYRAPERPGATFATGNAGGLKIDVDGVQAPALGPAGVVRKNVSLDADLLKAGRALP